MNAEDFSLRRLNVQSEIAGPPAVIRDSVNAKPLTPEAARNKDRRKKRKPSDPSPPGEQTPPDGQTQGPSDHSIDCLV